MKLDREEAQIIITALQNYRSELYINNNDTQTLAIADKLCKNIEEEMEAKDISQGKIPVTEDMYTVKDEDNVGSETGIERDYALQGKPNCEVCDD